MKNECDQCGTCCEKGGPSLHEEDLILIRNGILSIDDLVTIRKGEIVLQPETGKPEITEVELIKIQGRDGSWCCRFLDPAEKTCSIYEQRPMSCRLLECWNPEAVLEVSGKKLLNRLDILDDSDSLLPLLSLYDEQLNLPDMIEISVRLRSEFQRESTLAELHALVEKDLLFRSLAIKQFALPVSTELFYFGRPLFHLLSPLGVSMKESVEGIRLHYEEQEVSAG
jgi:Fe-S-cluster containining protein